MRQLMASTHPLLENAVPIPETLARRRRVWPWPDAPKLILCVALGVWLGGTAALLTGWLAYRVLTGAAPPVPEAAGRVIRPSPSLGTAAPPDAADGDALGPGVAPGQNPTASGGGDSGAMFDQYQENLRNQQLQQVEQQARINPRNLSNAKCQFWLQQAQTAPTPKNRENVAQFCE